MIEHYAKINYGELELPHEQSGFNRVTGQFLKGHVPTNKGKKWSQWMSKRGQKRAAKGWKNLELHRGHPVTAGRNKKPVIAVSDKGNWVYLPDTKAAGEWIEGNRENVARCCRLNERRHVNRKTGAINTDHRYQGVRFYFESDDIWTTKIKTNDTATI